MDIILITDLEIPDPIRNCLDKHSVKELTGALELLRKWKRDELKRPDNVSGVELEDTLSCLEALFLSEGGIEHQETFIPPPMGVLMPDNDKEQNNE